MEGELLSMAKDTKIDPKKTSTSSNSPATTPANSKDPLQGVSTELHSIRNRDFLQEAMMNFVDWMERNKAIVAGVVALAILAGAGVVGWDLISERKEKTAQESFYAVEKLYSERRQKFDQAKFGALSGAKVEDLIKAGTAARPSGDLAKDYGTVIDELESFANDNKGTTASVQASLLAAETRIEYKQADQALKTLETSVQATRANSLVGALARMATGNAQAASGKCDLALKSWEEVLSAKDLGFLHSEAALRAGLCLEKSGDKPKAIEMYRKASAESEKSTSAQTARSLLRALELGT